MDTTNWITRVYKRIFLDALCLWYIMWRLDTILYRLLLFTSKTAIENFKVEVDVQITILQFYKSWKCLCLPDDLNGYLLVNLDSIISWASMMHVAWSDLWATSYRWDIFIAFLKFESESDLGMRYFICK